MEELTGAMLLWFLLTAASVVFVVFDSITNGVTSWVQRAAWILVTIYAGPVGLFFYLMACRRPFPGGHDAFTKPRWKQAVNSEMHCLAGDATGVVVAASVLAFVNLDNGWDITVEYLAAFVSGLLIFQALMMRGMYGGDYWKAVRKTFFAETVSMNMVMTGMIPVMVILEAAWPGSDHPLSASFWFRMGLATIVGGIIAFPINYWMVSSHLKHGCMTLPGADGPAPDLGHRSAEMAMHGGAGTRQAGQAMSMPMGHDMPMTRQNAGGASAGSSMPDMAGMPKHGMQMHELSAAQAAIWIVATFALLVAAVFVTAQFVPIRF